MKTRNLHITDHLGHDFEQQGLLERKRRVDAQIEEHIYLHSQSNLSPASESMIEGTLHHLLMLQSDYSKKIKFIEAICLN